MIPYITLAKHEEKMDEHGIAVICPYHNAKNMLRRCHRSDSLLAHWRTLMMMEKAASTNMGNKERAPWKKYDSSAAGTKVSATRKKHCMSMKGRAVGYKEDDKGDDKEESIASNSAIPGHKLYLR
jgi:hypothetical protein